MVIQPISGGNANNAPQFQTSNRVIQPISSAQSARNEPGAFVTAPQAQPKQESKLITSVRSVFDGFKKAVTSKPNPDEGLGAPFGRLLQKAPDRIYPKVAEKYKSKGLYDEIVDFVGQMPGSVAQSWGKSLELLSTKEGKKELKQGIKNLPKTVSEVKDHMDNKRWGEALTTAFANPAISVAFDVADFIPIGNLATMGIKTSARSAMKKFVKETIEETGGKIVKNAVKPQAAGKSLGKEAISEGSSGIPSNSFSAGKPTSTQARSTSLKAVSAPSGVSSIRKMLDPLLTKRGTESVIADANINRLQKIGQENKADFDSIVTEVAKDIGGTFKTRIKSPESIKGKIIRFQNESRNADEFADVLAGRVITTQDKVQQATEAVTKKLKVVDSQDYFKSPSPFGYRGINIQARLKNGEPVEFQVHTEQSKRVADAIHPIYEKWRDLKVIPKNRMAEHEADKIRSNKIANDLMKGESEIKVPRNQLPVGEGKEKLSRLEARVTKSLDKAPQEIKDQLGLSTYKEMSKKENIAKASDYVSKNPNEALAVLAGEKEAPKGILRNSIYVAMQNLAEGDVALARRLASLQSTRLGQELSILTEIDPDSPVKLMSDIVKVREEAFKRRYSGKTPTEMSNKVVADIQKRVKTPDKYDWGKFVESIKC
ncbi:MAG: RelA/SpoT domain-containing protein [Candidatus Curtissbacteria bacterium]|nr:RelA/SpoT domain-containing protein [Candidatus Curtissbacteria bacterium]